jgi:hypothetical protein
MHKNCWWGNLERNKIIGLGVDDRRVCLKFILSMWEGVTMLEAGGVDFR